MADSRRRDAGRGCGPTSTTSASRRSTTGDDPALSRQRLRRTGSWSAAPRVATQLSSPQRSPTPRRRSPPAASAEAVHDAHCASRTHRAAKGADGKVQAKAARKATFVTITAEARSAKAAALLANYYAQTYIERQNGNYQREVEAAIAITRRQLRRIEAAQAASRERRQHSELGERRPPARARAAAGGSAVIQAANLAQQDQPARIGALGISSVKQINPPNRKTRALVSPHAEKERDLRVRGRPPARRHRGLRARPPRPPAALARPTSKRSSRRRSSPRCPPSRRADRSPRRTATARRRCCASRCGGCTRRCSWADTLEPERDGAATH